MLELYGIFLEQSRENILREKDAVNKSYLYGLFWSNEPGENNKDEFMRVSQKHHMRLGHFVCQYILSAYDNERDYCHYFECWVEII